MTECPICEAKFELTEDSGDARPPFPSDWKLWVAHDHAQEPAVWRAVLFHHSARERYPEEAKAVKEVQATNHKKLKTRAQVRNDSVGKRTGSRIG